MDWSKLLAILQSKRVLGYLTSVIVTLAAARGFELDPETVAWILAALTGALTVSDGIRPVAPKPLIGKPDQ